MGHVGEYAFALILYVLASALFVFPARKGWLSGKVGLTFTTLVLIVVMSIVTFADDTPKETYIGVDMSEMDNQMLGTMIVSFLAWLPLAVFAAVQIGRGERIGPGSRSAARKPTDGDD